MNNSKINIGKALLQTLNLLILKQFTLPYKIYKNSLINLSNSESQDSAESTLSDDFPLYVWYVNIFDALIFLDISNRYNCFYFFYSWSRW